MKKKIRVLIVDDSAVVRLSLTSILEKDKDIEVMGTAFDPYFAVKKIQKEVPDVITLDIEMPRMDGLTFLRKIMSQHPIPVVIISSLTTKGAETSLKALEYGAVEVITKPQMQTKQFFEESRIHLCDIIKAASMSRLKKKRNITPLIVKPKLSADAMIPEINYKFSKSMLRTTDKVIAVGASTGGTEALRVFLSGLPINSPGVVVVQHMPEKFTLSFSKRLNEICKINIKEAKNGDKVLRGRVLIAQGNSHLLLKRSGAKYYVEVKKGPLVNRHRPSVDVLFRSTARYAGKNAIGIILTGMGDDGAKGILEMKKSGAKTIAQNEKTCVVFGMPKEAIKLGGIDEVLPLEIIATKAINLINRI